MRKCGWLVTCAAASAIPSDFGVPGTPLRRKKRIQSSMPMAYELPSAARKSLRFIVFTFPVQIAHRSATRRERSVSQVPRYARCDRLHDLAEVAVLVPGGVPQREVHGALVLVEAHLTAQKEEKLRL